MTPKAESERWRKALIAEFGIEDAGGLLILQTAAEAFVRMRLAQESIHKDGMTTTDRWGQVKPHPLLNTERDARGQLLGAIKQLNLDLEPLHPRPGRPPLDGGD